MKKFSFRFESVEKVRKLEEDLALRDLGNAQRKLKSTIEYRDELVRQKEESSERREKIAASTPSVIDFQLENDFIEGHKIRILRADQQVVRAQRQVEREMMKYLDSRRKLKAMETLRDREFREYKKELEKERQKEIDDNILMRRNTKTMIGGER